VGQIVTWIKCGWTKRQGMHRKSVETVMSLEQYPCQERGCCLGNKICTRENVDDGIFIIIYTKNIFPGPDNRGRGDIVETIVLLKVE
jgi:hypothetical protein